MATIFISNREIANIKAWCVEVGLDFQSHFSDDGFAYCGRHYYQVVPAEGKISINEYGGVRCHGLGTFYNSDDDEEQKKKEGIEPSFFFVITIKNRYTSS